MKELENLIRLLPINNTNAIAIHLFNNIQDVFVADTFAMKELSSETSIEVGGIKKSLKELVNLGFLKQIHTNRFAKNPEFFNVSDDFEKKYQTYTNYVPKRKNSKVV